MSEENTFIRSVSKWVIDNHASTMHEVTIVVPAKRSIRFFSNELVSEFTKTKTPSILPEIITLTDLFDRLTPVSKLSQVELIFHFYEVYSQIESNPEPFEQFFTWAPSLLGDFNEIDNYMIDPVSLYRDLRNLKEQEIIIEGWSFDRPELSKGQQNLNEFWVKLPTYYKKLKEYLVSKNIGYSGLINRMIASDIVNVFSTQQNRKYIIAGFNALTKCEIAVFNYLLEQKKAHLFFDNDNYYSQNELHEAGLFMRSNNKDFNGNIEFINANSLSITKKKINYNECNGEALQCEEVVNILMAMPIDQLERTAIVLCNEQLLPVLINSLPSKLLRVNVTMGWPLRFTKANDFFNVLIDLNIAFSRSKNFIQSELIAHFIVTANSFSGSTVINENLITSKTELIELFKDTDLYEILNSASNSIAKFIQSSLTYIQKKIDLPQTHLIDGEILAHYNEVFNKLLLLPGFEEHISSWYLFKQLFNKFTRNYPLAFVGEPLAGVQVMGMLETRALDFDTVFILSANEGYLPAQSVYTGYIPYDLRAHYKLPGKTEQDAVFAYYFYRLLQRSKSAHIFYNTQNELLQQAERSRYLLQIEKELLDMNPLIILETKTIDAQLLNSNQHFNIVKSDFYFEKLNSLMKSGFSATMLLNFCKCKLGFYHKYILGFRDERDLYQLDESGIGNMVHYFFNRIFSKIVNEKPDLTFFKNEITQIETTLQEVILDKFKGYNFNSGQNFLALQMVKKMILSFLQKQCQGENIFISKTVVGSEINLESQLIINEKNLKLKGSIDLLLVDDANNYLVFDFKTGKVDEDNLKLNEKNTLTLDLFNKRDKLMQLMVYKKLVTDNYKVNSVESYIIPLATGSIKPLSTELVNISDETLITNFTEIVLDEMLNATTIIEHNEKSLYCEFCL